MDLTSLLATALDARSDLLDEKHVSAFRLFNGFLEGCPQLAADLYASTLLLHNYADDVGSGFEGLRKAQSFYLERLPWLRCVLVKTRHAVDPQSKRGQVAWGQAPANRIREQGVWYALDLTMNRDASFYLDTRSLRRWLIDNSGGRRVLNTFAYTGSLGVAAMAGGAVRVVQLDLNRAFLNLAKTSYTLNGFPIHNADFLAGDFFTQAAALNRAGARFDLVLLDAPFFSVTSKGRVDLEGDSARLINKVRPLLEDGGLLVAINNALYLSGEEYMRTLERLCADGYLRVKELIPVPADCLCYSQTCFGAPVSDPAPFNHSTKIAVLEVRRKG